MLRSFVEINAALVWENAVSLSAFHSFDFINFLMSSK